MVQSLVLASLLKRYPDPKFECIWYGVGRSRPEANGLGEALTGVARPDSRSVSKTSRWFLVTGSSFSREHRSGAELGEDENGLGG